MEKKTVRRKFKKEVEKAITIDFTCVKEIGDDFLSFSYPYLRTTLI